MQTRLMGRNEFFNDQMLLQNINEWSKNEPIPELRDKNLFVILLGSPGSGKSYFTKNFLNKYNDFKVFDPDSINFKRNLHGINPEKEKLSPKDANKHISFNTGLVYQYLKNALTTKDNKEAFVYDTTGSNINNIKEVSFLAKELGYTVVIILIHRDLETAKSSTISRQKIEGREVDLNYLEEVYDKLRKNWKLYSEFTDSYYIVDSYDNAYHFWKLKNGSFQKKEATGWVQTEEPNLYASAVVMNESRSTIITRKQFIDEIKNNCSDYLSINDKPVFYRGLDSKNAYLKIKPSEFTRFPRGQQFNNYFGELFDDVSSKLNWPSRYKSVIMSNDRIIADSFGEVYIIIPTNNCTFIASPKVDYWLSFKDILDDVGGFNQAIQTIVNDLHLEKLNHTQQLDKIGEAYINNKDSFYLYIKLFDRYESETKGNISFSNYLKTLISSSIDNNDWKLFEIKQLDSTYKNPIREFWTEGECYLIKKSILEHSPLLKKELGFKNI